MSPCVPAVGTGNDPSCAAPGHGSHVEASLYCTGVLEAMKTRHLEKHSNQVHKSIPEDVNMRTIQTSVHWSCLRDQSGLPSSRETRRRRDSCHSWPAVEPHRPPPAGGTPSSRRVEAAPLLRLLLLRWEAQFVSRCQWTTLTALQPQQ